MRAVALALVSVLLLACAATAPALGPGGEPSSSQGMTQTSGSLTVKLLEPQDGAAVETNVVKVKGEAPPETVVTVNDDILVVESDGKFEIDVPLEPGPNVIEIVASDLEGNEVSFEITVTYQP
jgi:hypothetical protein